MISNKTYGEMSFKERVAVAMRDLCRELASENVKLKERAAELEAKVAELERVASGQYVEAERLLDAVYGKKLE